MTVGTESLPSIHNGPQAFKNMINTNKQSEQPKDYQMEMLRRVSGERMRIYNGYTVIIYFNVCITYGLKFKLQYLLTID